MLAFHILAILGLLSGHATCQYIPSALAGSSGEEFTFSSQFGTPGVNASYDYIVIGGGTSGLTVAKRLAENASVSVAVIEAGGFYQTSGPLCDIPAYSGSFDGMIPSSASAYPTIDWGYVTTPQAGLGNKTFHFSSGKTLGGCTAINGQVYHRTTKQSMDRWADAVGDRSYKFDEFLRFYCRSANFSLPDNAARPKNASVPVPPAKAYSKGAGPLHLSYTVDDSAWFSWAALAFKESGIPPTNDFLTGSLMGYQWTPGTVNPTSRTRDTAQTSFLNAHWASQNSNLKVYVQALARRIVFSEEKIATAVEVQTGRARYRLTAKKEIILSAGAFNSPQLLMLSGIGPEETLKKFDIPVVSHLPGVGQNLIDQPLFGLSALTNVETLTGAASNPDRLAEVTLNYTRNRRGLLTQYPGLLAFEKLPNRTGLGVAAAKDLASFPKDWPEIEYLPLQGALGLLSTGGGPLALPFDGNVGGFAVAIMTPLSRGSVTLASADPLDPPSIDPNWLTHPTDRRLAVEAFRRARDILSAKSLQPALLSAPYPSENSTSTDEDILRFIADTFSTIWHPSSTCAMGKATDPMAVVDSHARVFGVKRLRVVDVSVFPFLPPGHPMALAYALGEKIADLIRNGE